MEIIDRASQFPGYLNQNSHPVNYFKTIKISFILLPCGVTHKVLLGFLTPHGDRRSHSLGDFLLIKNPLYVMS